MSADLPSEGLLDRATDPEYAAVSPRAVLGLVLSVVGVSALAAWPLVAVPVGGALVSLWALVRVRRSEGVLTGGRLALAGAILGGALAVLAGGYHAAAYASECATLKDLGVRALEVTDHLVAGRYESVYGRLSETRRGQVRPEVFASYCRARFEGAGPFVRRDLEALRIIRDAERGLSVAPVEMRVELSRRILRVAVIFERAPGGRWDLAGVQAEPTFESMVKFGEGGPRALPSDPTD
jgi:hypothetical protein